LLVRLGRLGRLAALAALATFAALAALGSRAGAALSALATFAALAAFATLSALAALGRLAGWHTGGGRSWRKGEVAEVGRGVSVIEDRVDGNLVGNDRIDDIGIFEDSRGIDLNFEHGYSISVRLQFSQISSVIVQSKCSSALSTRVARIIGFENVDLDVAQGRSRGSFALDDQLEKVNENGNRRKVEGSAVVRANGDLCIERGGYHGSWTGSWSIGGRVGWCIRWGTRWGLGWGRSRNIGW